MTTARSLTEADFPWVLELFAANSRDALTPEERAERGFVQGRFTPESLRARMSNPASVVAEVDGKPAGVLLGSAPDAAPDGPPARAVETAREHGMTDFYLHGAALVAPEARGHGVLRAMTDEMLRRAAATYTHGIAFIEKENTVSTQAHQHLGWTPLGTFSWQGREYSVVSHPVAQ